MDTVVVRGMGELGTIFAQGFLRAGATVVPMLRSTSVEATERPGRVRLCLVAVGEADLDSALATLPERWRPKVGLLQNELLPYVWQRHGIEDPTVAVVWFEKKPGTPVTQILPSPVGGPEAALMVLALEECGIEAFEIEDGRQLTEALVAKNLYILVSNLAGLEVGGTVEDVWHSNRDLSEAVASEVLDVQEALVGHAVDRSGALATMERAIEADPAHKATGRSAPDRLARALRNAAQFDLPVPTLRRLAEAHLP